MPTKHECTKCRIQSTDELERPTWSGWFEEDSETNPATPSDDCIVRVDVLNAGRYIDDPNDQEITDMLKRYTRSIAECYMHPDDVFGLSVCYHDWQEV